MAIDLSALKQLPAGYQEARAIQPAHFEYPIVGGSAVAMGHNAILMGGMTHRMALARDFMAVLLKNAVNEAIPHKTLAAGSVALADALIAELAAKPQGKESE